MTVISFADVLKAQKRIAGVAHRTPVLRSETADLRTGAKLFFKCENFQRMGAFKFRGALNALKQFTPAQREAGVLTFSSGNHAQAIALSARLLGMQATIVMPADAPAAKIAATEGYGGRIVHYDRYTENREAITEHLAVSLGLTVVPPYDHPHVIAGQGTAAKELLEDEPELDLLLVPVGGGGFLAGSAIAVKEMTPNCTLIGVEPEAGNDGQQSLLKGEIVHIKTPDTIADGAQSQHLGLITFPIIKEHVRKIVTVSDAQLIEAMIFYFSRMKLVVEPTGCLTLAAALSNKIDIVGKRVGILISGGNVDPAIAFRLLNNG